MIKGGLAEIDGLRDAWLDLLEDSPSASIVRSHSWCRSGFENISRYRNGKFCALLVKDKNTLVGLWPFVVFRKGLYAEAVPLAGGGCEEYGGPLIRSGADVDAVSDIFVSGLPKVGDYVPLYNLPQHHRVTRAVLGRSTTGTFDKVPAPYIDFSPYGNFDEYMASLSKALRSDAKYQAKRLDKIGATFQLLENTDEIRSTIEWIISQKRQWVIENGKNVAGPNGRWLMSDESLRFFVDAANNKHDTGAVGIFAIKSQDQIIAAAICLIDKELVEYYITTYDPKWSVYSPGKVLVLKIAGWAFDSGRNFDFRMTAAAYKDSWANAERTVVSAMIAATPMGLPPVWKTKMRKAEGRLRQAVGKALPRQWVARLKRR